MQLIAYNVGVEVVTARHWHWWSTPSFLWLRRSEIMTSSTWPTCVLCTLVTNRNFRKISLCVSVILICLQAI